MKNGKFENQAEIYQALLDSHKIYMHGEDVLILYWLSDGNIVNEECCATPSFYYPSDWSIYKEPKKREVIELYETWDSNGKKCVCDSKGSYPNFKVKTMDGYGDHMSLRKRNIINSDKPTLVIDAETFEIVRGE